MTTLPTTEQVTARRQQVEAEYANSSPVDMLSRMAHRIVTLEYKLKASRAHEAEQLEEILKLNAKE